MLRFFMRSFSCSFSVFSFSWEEGQSWDLVAVPSLPLFILAMASSTFMCLCVSAVAGSHWKKSSKSRTQFFVVALVVGVAMLSILNSEMVGPFPSFLEKVNRMNCWLKNSSKMLVSMGLKYIFNARIQSPEGNKTRIWFSVKRKWAILWTILWKNIST